MELKHLDLAQIVDRFIEDQDAAEQEDRKQRYANRDHFFFSESGSCGRKIAYDFYGTIPADGNTATGARIYHNGEYVQLRYEQYLRMMGVFVAREVSLRTYEKHEDDTMTLVDGIPVAASGRSDIIVDYKRLSAMYEYYFKGAPVESIPEPLVPMEAIELEPGFTYYRPTTYLSATEIMAIEAQEPGRLAIVEMKSASTYSYGMNAKSGMAKPEHQGQLSWYQFITGIQHGWVAYENKNDQQFESYYVERDENTIVNESGNPGYAQQFLETQGYIDQGLVPPRCPDADPKNFPCKWKSGRCRYYEHCWSEEHNGEYIPGMQEDVAADDITLEEIQGWFNGCTPTFWVKMIDENGHGNVVHASMPEALRNQMLEYLYPNSVEVEWEGMYDEVPAEEVPAEQVEYTQTEEGLVPTFNDPTGTLCSVCQTPQYNTPGGVTCEQGHGGADAHVEPAPQQQKAAPPKPPKPPKAEPAGPPKVIKVTWEDLTAGDGKPIITDMTHDEYVSLCEAEGQDACVIRDAEELLPGYFDKLTKGEDPTELWANMQSQALSAKSTAPGVKQSEGVAVEQVTPEGQKYIFCAFSNCEHGDPVEFKRLGNGGTIKCPGCKQTNKVVRLED